MADSIKGNAFNLYDSELKKGILLHRFIDRFTDSHPIYRKSKHRLHEKYGHYSGVIMDILYDHFLAKNWATYSEIPLAEFAATFYELVQDHETLLTERAKSMVPYMIKNNWLVAYASISGLEMILVQMDYRTKHRVHMQEAVIELLKFYSDFEDEFTQFFDELIDFCQQKTNEFN